MKNVAFLTYNTVGEDLSNGWHDGLDGRRAFLLQNSRGNRWAVDANIPAEYRNSDTAPPGYSRVAAENVDRVHDEIGILWGQLQEILPSLDHVVVYVGSSGSECAIALAAQLPASKVTFVACDCGLPFKEILIQTAGLLTAGRVLCECGGRRTLKRLFDSFLQSGELLPRAS